MRNMIASFGKNVLLRLSLAILAVFVLTPMASAQGHPPADTISTSNGDLTIQPVRHASLVMMYKDKVIYIDPVGGVDLYLDLPKPDLILITHVHGDHTDPATLNALVAPSTPIIAPAAVRAKLTPNLQQRVLLMQNGQQRAWQGINIEAVSMYNITPDRLDLHPKGLGNGYVMTFGNERVYIAGDTEPTPEMAALKNIDIAFLPMNQPFTMTPQQAAEAVRSFRPKIVYPYHYRGTDIHEFARLVGDAAEVRLRDWYEQQQ